MCRLFGMTAGSERVHATFWLLGSADSMVQQSHRNPDGTGLGTFDERGNPVVEKQPMAAWSDDAFASEARRRSSSTFVAHVRQATSGGLTEANTHPFAMDGRLFAHNGAITEVGRLEEHLGADLDRVHGETDSERIFALVSREIERAGDVRTGLVEALGWLATNVGVFSLNLVLTTATELFAVRYPETHELYLLDRREVSGSGRLDQTSRQGTRVQVDELSALPSVVVASEPLDADAWQLLDPGELVHVDRGLGIHRTVVLPHPPSHRVAAEDVGHG
jgi:predicted glutamine amidotransferase